MCKNYYDEDDYEVDAINTVYEGEYFGDMDEELGDFDMKMEEMDAELSFNLRSVEGDLSIAIAEGDVVRAERLQDEIELLLMADFNLREM